MAAGDVMVYSLTPLTRGASLQRRVVFAGFDVAARTLIVAGCALVPALVLTAILWVAFAGEYSLAVVPIVEAAAFWLVESRTRNGLHLRQYRAIYDRRKAAVGKFYCCGVEIFPGRSKALTLVSASVPLASRPAQFQRRQPQPVARRRRRRGHSEDDTWSDLVAP